MPTATELRQKRAVVIGDCRAIADKYPSNDTPWSAEDRQVYDRAWAESNRLKDEIAAMEADTARRQQVTDALAAMSQRVTPAVQPDAPGSGPAYAAHAAGDGASLAMPYSFNIQRRWQTAPQKITLAGNSEPRRRHLADYRSAWSSYLATGRPTEILHYRSDPVASLQTDLSTSGGYMVAPEQFVAELLMNVDDQRWIRKLARTFTTNAQTLGAVKRTAKMASFAWGSELTDSETNKDTTLAYGKRSLTPHYMVGMIQVSRDLLRSALLPADEFVRYEIARDSGELEENGFLTGNGTQQPLGLFTADNNGIDTGRDVSTGNTTTAIGADNLRAMKYKLKPQYRAHPSLAWLWHRDAINQISRLKDGVGQYLWRDGITAGDPDSILGINVYESEFAPNTFTTGLYVGMLGAFFYYWIADSLEMDLQILVEKYANTNQIGYIARRKTDGMPQIAEAFARSKLA